MVIKIPTCDGASGPQGFTFPDFCAAPKGFINDGDNTGHFNLVIRPVNDGELTKFTIDENSLVSEGTLIEGPSYFPRSGRETYLFYGNNTGIFGFDSKQEVQGAMVFRPSDRTAVILPYSGPVVAVAPLGWFNENEEYCFVFGAIKPPF